MVRAPHRARVRGQDVTISVATESRWLHKLGVHRLDHLDVDGEPAPRTQHHQGLVAGPHAPHRREKGRQDPRRWRVAYPRHQLRPSSCRPRAAAKAKACAAGLGYTYIHSAVDGFSRLVYTEALPGETAKTVIGFFFRARVWFAAHGITLLMRVVTDIQSGWAISPGLLVDGREGSGSSGIRPSSLLDRVEGDATPCLLTVLAEGANAGVRDALLGTRRPRGADAHVDRC